MNGGGDDFAEYEHWSKEYGYSRIIYLCCKYDSNKDEFDKELNCENFFDRDPKFKSTMLHIACEDQNYKLCELLVSFMKANNLPMIFLNETDIHGDTPMHTAAYLGNKRIVNLLCENGADSNIQNCDKDTVQMILTRN